MDANQLDRPTRQRFQALSTLSHCVLNRTSSPLQVPTPFHHVVSLSIEKVALTTDVRQMQESSNTTINKADIRNRTNCPLRNFEIVLSKHCPNILGIYLSIKHHSQNCHLFQLHSRLLFLDALDHRIDEQESNVRSTASGVMLRPFKKIFAPLRI